jgi:hypothetical protein
MGLVVTPDACAVTIGGTSYPLAAVSAAVDALAPEVDSIDLSIPWGDRRIQGAANPSESLPALGAEVVATCGSWTWRGLLTRRTRSAAGRRRFLGLTAHGPGLALDRSYLPSFARVGVSGVIQVPGGPRFAPGTMSATTTTVGGAAVRYLINGGGTWTVAEALASYVAHAVAYAGLPAITIDTGSADQTRELADTDTDGLSVHAGLCAILGYRLGLVWRIQLTASGWVLRVRGLSGTGAAVDLTGGDVIAYDVGEDNSAALADLEVRGGRKVYAVSIDGKTSGDLVANWSGGDESARAAGDRSSPAFRRFTLATFALPDGSPSSTADPVPTLPIAPTTSLLSGSSPWLLFAQLTSDSSWVSLQGRVSIAVGGGQIWIEGIDPAEWATWSRIRLTLALSPRAYLNATRTGGSGLGRGLAVVGTRHAYASSAATRISGSSLATVTGSAVAEQDPIDDEADALWASLGSPQIVASWTRDGISGGDPKPGDRITSFSLPRPGTTPTTVSCDCICTSRRVARVRGRMQTTWEAGPRPYATGAIAR